MAAKKDEDSTVIDAIVNEYSSYEQYLDSQITPTDLFYLEVIFEYKILINVIILYNYVCI